MIHLSGRTRNNSHRGNERHMIVKRKERVFGVTRNDRATLQVIAVEQRIRRLPAQYKGQLPAYIVYILNGGAEPETTTGRVPVRSIANQERAAYPKSIRDDSLELPVTDVDHI